MIEVGIGMIVGIILCVLWIRAFFSYHGLICTTRADRRRDADYDIERMHRNVSR